MIYLQPETNNNVNTTFWENSTNLVNPYFTWKLVNKQSLVETIFYAEDFSQAPWYYNSFTVSVYNPLPPDELDVIVTQEDSCDNSILVIFNGTSFPESYQYQSVGYLNGKPYYILVDFGGYYLFYDDTNYGYPSWVVSDLTDGTGTMYAQSSNTGDCPYVSQFDFVSFLWEGVTDLGVFVSSNNFILPTYVNGTLNGYNTFYGEISGPNEYINVYYDSGSWFIDYTNTGITINVASIVGDYYPPVNASWDLSGLVPGLINIATNFVPAPGPKEGWINIPAGEYTYTVYQMNKPADLDLADAVKEVETGILIMNGTFSAFETYQTTNPTYSVYTNMDRI